MFCNCGLQLLNVTHALHNLTIATNDEDGGQLGDIIGASIL